MEVTQEAMSELKGIEFWLSHSKPELDLFWIEKRNRTSK